MKFRFGIMTIALAAFGLSVAAAFHFTRFIHALNRDGKIVSLKR